ncbi:Mitochondrial presequence protease [Spiromyces aspiralis]|uniref:Mitochondrial presequence protease n=1 Tax=Spiromyces aspiralis TaxID=68401 RepID=A0ACC1HEE5_9FUNG|nr:Mitochondrial presequence protease [Spiromyces aspiralis]
MPNRQTSLSVGLQGISVNDIPKIEGLIGEVLSEVKTKGFEAKRIEAVLQSIELSYKHKTANFGLNLMRSISTGWFHGCNPIDLLELNKNIARLRDDIKHGNFFERMVDKYFVESKHQLNYTMVPDSEYHKRLDEDEQRRLEEKLSVLTPADIKTIYSKTEQLAKEQAKREDLSCLPTLKLEDVPRKGARYAVDLSAAECIPVQWRTTSTNGISYLSIINAFQSLPGDLTSYLPLFCDALTYLGTTKRDIAEIETDIRLYSGGITFGPVATTDHSSLELAEQGIMFSSHCLDANIPKMYELILELTSETDFRNVKRLKTLIAANAANLFDAIPNSGHFYARGLASSTLTSEMELAESYDGLNQVRFMSQLAALDDLTPVSEKLEAIRTHVFNKLGVRTAIITNKGSVDENQAQIDHFIEAYPGSPSHSKRENGDRSSGANTYKPFTPAAARLFCPLPFATNFAAKSVRTVPFAHPDSVKLQTLAKLLTPNFLHREIREINGAYGGGATFTATQGIFSFFSYRDPNPVNTIKTFERSVEWILSHDISEREMREAKLSIFGGLDAPLSVSQESMRYFTTGITDDMLQARREEFFSVTAKDVKEAAEKYLLARQSASEDSQFVSSLAIIGEQDLADNEKIKDWTRVSV